MRCPKDGHAIAESPPAPVCNLPDFQISNSRRGILQPFYDESFSIGIVTAALRNYRLS